MLLFVVERAKKCLDHAVTVFCVHLLLTLTRGSGFPAKPEWWIMEVVGVASMAVLGEWLCIQKELKETSIGSLGQIVRQQRYVLPNDAIRCEMQTRERARVRASS